MSTTHDIKEYLSLAASSGASDLFLIAGAPASMRVDGRMRKSGDRLLPADTGALLEGLYASAGRDRGKFDADGGDDFSFALPGLARFRVNAYHQRGSAAMVVRVVPFGIPDPDEAMLPRAVMDFAGLHEGLVLVTGTAGSGKSTTLACILEKINQERDAHIVTLEDPIEYLYKNAEGIVSQREIGIDVPDYMSGLRACLREAPDVILLGEMRDAETAQAAMSAAETGHLVLATLHTKGAANAVDRLVDMFQPGQQAQARAQLAMVTDAVVFQELLPRASGGRVPAFEILRFTPAVRSLVREGRTHQLDAAIADGRNDGMVRMSDSVQALVDKGLVDRSEAARFLPEQDVPAQPSQEKPRRRW